MGSAKVARVVKVHIHQTQAHDRAGNLGAKTERDAFIRLNVNYQAIDVRILDGRLAEKHERRLAKLHGDFRDAPGKALAGANVKRHTAPAPVFNLQFSGDEGFRV